MFLGIIIMIIHFIILTTKIFMSQTICMQISMNVWREMSRVKTSVRTLQETIAAAAHIQAIESRWMALVVKVRQLIMHNTTVPFSISAWYFTHEIQMLTNVLKAVTTVLRTVQTQMEATSVHVILAIAQQMTVKDVMVRQLV